MRWNSKKTDKAAEVVALVVFFPLWIPALAMLFVLIWTENLLKALKRSLQHKKTPHRWFAWHPVKYDLWSDHAGESAWLETVWRARNASGQSVTAPTRESLERAM